MADTVANYLLRPSNRYGQALLSCISDGTGETAAVKLAKANFSYNGAAPAGLGVGRIISHMQGFASLRLYWKRASTDTLIATLAPGTCEFPFANSIFLEDQGSGGTGDIVLTSVGAINGATYSILLDYVLY